MSLQERVSQEIKAAMLAKDADRLSTLRLLKSALGYAQDRAQAPRVNFRTRTWWPWCRSKKKRGATRWNNLKRAAAPNWRRRKTSEITVLERFPAAKAIVRRRNWSRLVSARSG